MAAKKASKKTIVARGKRKEAIARATVKEGKQALRYNGLAIQAVSPHLIREVITEPLKFVDATKYSITVNAVGGGSMGQAQAARTAIAKALVELHGDELRKKMMAVDRTLVVEDARRVEPKKFKGPKARARFTKSYR
jgi:small subunit ribosomal protein S9